MLIGRLRRTHRHGQVIVPTMHQTAAETSKFARVFVELVDDQSMLTSVAAQEGQ
jgi:hypothetical protein